MLPSVQQPDEDERVAGQALQGAGNKRKHGDTYDVLDDHHSRNRKPRAPDAQRLQLSAQQAGPQSDDSDESAVQPKAKRAKRHSKTPYKFNAGDPTQLQFYSGTWVDILELAKRYFRLWIATEVNFPERETHLSDATNCLTRAVNEHRQEGSEVEEGKSSLNDRSLQF